MGAILEPLRVPLTALLIGMGGVGLAWLWFDGRGELAFAAVGAAIVVGVIANAVGRSLLPGRPVGALRLLEAWILIPVALATAAAAAVVVVTVELTLPDTTPTDTKELVGAVSTGVTTFLTAGFIAWAGDDTDSTLADHVQGAFEDHYTRPGKERPGVHAFAVESPGEFWVFAGDYSGASGWGRPARMKRAKGIAAELKSGNSEPTATPAVPTP